MPTRYRPKGIHTANMPFTGQISAVAKVEPVRPFITIAQQAGAECDSLPPHLAKWLDDLSGGSSHWSHWDQELIDKVAAESRIPAELISALDSSGHSLIDDLLCGLSGRTDEMIVFYRLKETVRELARRGNVILIGHGTSFMTYDMPAGLHIRLIAPMKIRVANVAARLNIPPRQAARYIRRLDRRRRAFFARFWPGRPFGPDMFAAILNIAELDEQRIVQAIAAMLPTAQPMETTSKERGWV